MSHTKEEQSMQEMVAFDDPVSTHIVDTCNCSVLHSGIVQLLAGEKVIEPNGGKRARGVIRILVDKDTARSIAIAILRITQDEAKDQNNA